MVSSLHTDKVTLAQNILDWLQDVKDPEIPTVSIVELGLIENIVWNENNQVEVSVIPTFSACPAMRMLQFLVKECLESHGIANPIVKISHTAFWSSDRISEKGRQQLLAFGISPPPQNSESGFEITATCPKCRSTNTRLLNTFGPTLCRAIHHCNDCHETFEQFKPL